MKESANMPLAAWRQMRHYRKSAFLFHVSLVFDLQ
jgi:hypothetical protein